MPLLARTYIKAGLICFVVGMVLLLLVSAQGPLGLSPQLGLLRPVYLHLLIVGWIMQLIMGVAYWMFPRYSPQQPRGSERLAWAVFVLLNTGLLLRTAGEPLAALQQEMGWMLALSAVLQLLAGWGFVLNIWPRVRER